MSMRLCLYILYLKIFLGCETFEQLLKTFQLSRGMLGEILSAFEFLDSECMRLLNTHLKLLNPISGTHTRMDMLCFENN